MAKLYLFNFNTQVVFELSGIVTECVERLLKFVKTLFAS